MPRAKKTKETKKEPKAPSPDEEESAQEASEDGEPDVVDGRGEEVEPEPKSGPIASSDA